MVETRRLRQLLESAARLVQLPDDPVVVALSGGADSAALALLCVETGRRGRALHVNHGLPHSGVMEKAAQGVAEQLGLALQVVDVAVPAGASPEGRAREVRYRAFAEAGDDSESLLTAHTLDDNAETILINLVRGTGPRGMAGIPRFRPPNIYRPMLGFSRSESREIADLAGVPFADDPMNEDQTLTRNIIRSQIIPALQALNPQLVVSLSRMASSLARDITYLDALAAQAGPQLSEGRATFAVGAFLALPEPVADRVLIRLLGHVAGEGAVTAQGVEQVWSVVRGDSDRRQLGAGAVARRDGPMVVIETADRPEPPERVMLSPGVHEVGGLTFHVASFDGPCRVAPLSKWGAVFPAGTVLEVGPDGAVSANGDPAWVPGERRLPVAWYEPGAFGYLSVFVTEEAGWT